MNFPKNFWSTTIC